MRSLLDCPRHPMQFQTKHLQTRILQDISCRSFRVHLRWCKPWRCFCSWCRWSEGQVTNLARATWIHNNNRYPASRYVPEESASGGWNVAAQDKLTSTELNKTPVFKLESGADYWCRWWNESRSFCNQYFIRSLLQ